MRLMSGHNTANWRAAGTRFRETVLSKIETIVTMTPDMSVTAMYSDYVLPVAQHYERRDFVMEGRTPYVQVLDQAVPPLGESADDWTIMERLAKSISAKATARQLPPIKDVVFGQPIVHDYARMHELFTLNGRIQSTRDLAQFLLDNSAGLPKVTFEELASKGFIRVDDSADVQFGPCLLYTSPSPRDS